MNRLIRGIETFASLSLGLVTLITFAAVVMRFAFNSALPDSFDLTRLAQGVALAWGIAITTASSEHITLDIRFDWLGSTFDRIVSLIGRLITAVTLAVLRLPIWPVSALIAVGIAVAAVFAILLLFRNRKVSS
jgi:TRAP-type C4-dicarboxylate transport system permease small subunit